MKIQVVYSLINGNDSLVLEHEMVIKVVFVINWMKQIVYRIVNFCKKVVQLFIVDWIGISVVNKEDLWDFYVHFIVITLV